MEKESKKSLDKLITIGKPLYLRIDGDPHYVNSDWFKLECYGIPSRSKLHDNNVNQSTIDLRTIKLPVDPDKGELYDKIKELDDFYGSDNFKKQFFKENSGKYEYMPLIKKPVSMFGDEDDDIKSNKKYKHPDYVVASFRFEENSNKKCSCGTTCKSDKTLFVNARYENGPEITVDCKDMNDASSFLNNRSALFFPPQICANLSVSHIIFFRDMKNKLTYKLILEVDKISMLDKSERNDALGKRLFQKKLFQKSSFSLDEGGESTEKN